MELVRLLYVSCMTEACDMEELQEILRVSRENNEVKDITGFLHYDPAFFLQCLEGPRESVVRLYNDITCDARHTDVRLLAFEEAEVRFFSGWRMELLSTESLERKYFTKLGEKKFNPYGMSPKEALSFVVHIAQLHVRLPGGV